MSSYSRDSDVTESEVAESDEDNQSSGYSVWTSWKSQFNWNLHAIETFGDIAWSAQYQQLVLPGLEAGGTPIPLPLSTPRDAEVIRKACHQAPFGRGDETVVDESVRKTWEVGREGFQLLNPQWPNFVNALVKDASVALGMPQNVRADPYKLLLYDPGSFFKPHKDSEKAPGMIATLVICLPSIHQGGDVHTSHSGQKYVLTTSQPSAFDVTALAWFSDVTHEVKEITSGHRLVLTYNIVLEDGPSSRPSADGFALRQTVPVNMLKDAHAHLPDATRLFYPLSHKYSETGLSLHSMKGVDRARVYALQKACASSEYILLLANITRTYTGLAEGHYDEGYIEDHYHLTYAATGEGAPVCKTTMDFQPNFIGPDPYERDADSLDGDEHLGNETSPPESRYHDSAAVIVRKDDLSKFLYLRALSDDTLAANVAELVTGRFYSSRDQAPNTTVDILKHLVELPKRGMGKTLPKILSFAIKTGDRDLWDEVITSAVTDFHRLVPGSRRYGDDYHRSRGLRSHLGEMAINLYTLENVNEALDGLLKGLNAEGARQSLQSWRLSIPENRFNRSKFCLEWNEASTIMAILQKGKGQDWVNESPSAFSLLPALKSRAEKSLHLALIPDLLDHKEIPDVEAIIKTIFWGTIDQLKVDESDLERHFKYPYEVSLFMALAKKLGLHGLSDEADRLIDNCCGSIAEAHRPKPVQLQTNTGMWGGLHVYESPRLLAEYILADFVDVVQQSGRPAPASLKPFFESLCGSSGNFIGREPERCRESGPCKELHDFLVSETEEMHRFELPWEERSHLQRGLPGNLFRCKEVDKSKDGASPAALVVTKLGKEYTLDLDIHKKDIANLEKRLLAFRTPFVRAALGDELYEELVLLGGIRKPPPGEDKDKIVPLSCKEPAAWPSAPLQVSEKKKRPASGSFEQPAASKAGRRSP
ncbi:hypothetical protein PG997_014637 [Apiospora hydei]|uniref:Prolyl 4-hydroxylase alpha subunit Fe(2+) 2OG dioxygenase domain-containing protein n=1 Tax=Apiospora hydei TaxID=1337664 RepID=A0ABR1UWV8_9PEZI